VRKPAGLLYGVQDRPPPPVVLLNGIQHVGVITINLIYPVLVFRLAGASTETITALVAVGMLILGVTTFMQAAPRGPIGTGYMCPTTFTATYLAPSLLAAKTGGLPLVFGMTLFAGVVESVLARALHRLRAVVPVELSGLVIILIGLTAALVGIRTLVGDSAHPPAPEDWTVAAVTLVVTIVLNIWGRGLARMLSALIGMTAGYIAGAALGLFAAADVEQLRAAAWIALPTFRHVSWSFDTGLIAAFGIAALAAAMKAMGTITMCQKANDADWVRSDNRLNARGVVADGLGSVLSGMMGGVGVNTSTPSVGIATASGVTSRIVAYAAGALFLLLALTPKFAAVLAIMPRPVMGAALVFAACFILISGLQIATSRLLDSRRTLTIGLGLVAGISIEVLPALSGVAPAWLRPITGSSLVFGTAVALVLNLLFRIGVRQRAVLTMEPAMDAPPLIDEFFRKQGAAWGARPEIVARATFGAQQLVEAVREYGNAEGPLELEAGFDEFSLDLQVRYRGRVLEIPDRRPALDEIRDSDDGAMRLAGYLLRRNADGIRAQQQGPRASIRFHFDH
jgi:NCS2 family nucleobase:cation symporter-2